MEGETQSPLLGLIEVSAQVVHHPERGSKVLQDASTFLQVPSKNCRTPQAWAWMALAACWLMSTPEMEGLGVHPAKTL